MTIKRRHFLLASGIGLAGLGAWRWLGSNPEDAIVNIVRKRLHYLTLDEPGLRRFAQDVLAKQFVSRNRLKMISAAGPLYMKPSFAGDDRLSRSVRHGEERLVSVYLLSSDFFQRGADMSRTVQYVDYYDPMKACGNPFARPITA